MPRVHFFGRRGGSEAAGNTLVLPLLLASGAAHFTSSTYKSAKFRVNTTAQNIIYFIRQIFTKLLLHAGLRLATEDITEQKHTKHGSLHSFFKSKAG